MCEVITRNAVYIKQQKNSQIHFKLQVPNAISYENSSECNQIVVQWKQKISYKRKFEEELLQLFSKVGIIAKMKFMVFTSGDSKGICYINFLHKQDFYEALNL